MNWQIADPAHLLSAMRISLVRGGQFLKSRIEPGGPILRERNLSYVHKTTWGMYASGVDRATIARLLDWAEKETLQPNGDFYFPQERPEYKDLQRVYRPLTFGKVAVWIDHPLIRRPQVLDRILQYRHKPSGGVFHYIGDDPAKIQQQPTIGTLNTTFFGHLMVELDMREEALAAGDWVKGWVEANRPHISAGRIYTQMTPAGDLVTDVAPGEAIFKMVDVEHPKQEFWQSGTSMAYLAKLYDVMRSRWDDSEDRARPYLDAALELLDFDVAMPLDTYLWPSKCKVGWGAAELLRVLLKYMPDRRETIEKAYRVAERVAVFTFLDNQLPDGRWSWMHYPLDSDIPEMAFNYKPLGNLLAVPPGRIDGSKTIWLPSEEITGEFLGELKAIIDAVAAWLGENG